MSEIVNINGYDIKDLKAIRSYTNIASMKSDLKLKEGMHVKTKGYYNANDGGSAEYYIRTKTNEDVEDNGSIHFIGDNLVGELIERNNSINIKQFGAKGDSIEDDTTSIQNAIDYGFNKKLKVIVPSTSNYYKTTFPLQLRIDRSDSNEYWGGNASYIEGESKSNSRIVKIGNSTDSNSIDATFIAKNSNTEMEKGTGITLQNLSIENYDDTEFTKTSGLCLWNDISRSTFKDLNINGFKGFDCSCFSSLFENIVFRCNQEALHLTNGTSNLFRFLYAPSCLNPYFIQSQYSTLLNVCCDNGRGDIFTVSGMGLTVQDCGCESKNATNIFVIANAYTTLSIKDFYMHRQVGDSQNDVSVEDCSIVKATTGVPIYIDTISIVESEHIEDNSYFFNIPENANVSTSIRNIRYYKNYIGTDNTKIKLWNNKPNQQSMQRLSTPTMDFNYFVNNNLKLVPYIGGYHDPALIDQYGNCLEENTIYNKKIWLNTKTKYTSEDGSDIRYSSRHYKGDIQLYNDPLTMNALGLATTNVSNNYTWDTLEIPIVLRGNTASRPSSNLFVGLQYFDTTLGKPIWYNGSNWKDATGNTV